MTCLQEANLERRTNVLIYAGERGMMFRTTGAGNHGDLDPVDRADGRSRKPVALCCGMSTCICEKAASITRYRARLRTADWQSRRDELPADVLPSIVRRDPVKAQRMVRRRSAPPETIAQP